MGYRAGDLVRLTAVFTSNITDLPADPTTIVFAVQDPRGHITNPTPVHDSTGIYHFDMTADLPGPYRWSATGTGNVQVSGEGAFSVDAPSF